MSGRGTCSIPSWWIRETTIPDLGEQGHALEGHADEVRVDHLEVGAGGAADLRLDGALELLSPGRG